MKQATGLAGHTPGSGFQWPGAATGRRSARDQASLAPQSSGHRSLEKGLSQASGVSGSGRGSSLLLPPAPGAPSAARLSIQMPTRSGSAFPWIPAAPASLSPVLRGLRRGGSWLPADAGGQPSAWPAAACGPAQHVRPASHLRHQGSCVSPPPPPATTQEERLPAVTNPAESRRRLRCSQSPREIVPRASPQPRGTGTRASLLGPLQPPGLGPAPQGLWQCLGGMQSTPWTWHPRSTCKAVRGCPRGMHSGVTVLPDKKAGMAPLGAAEERAAAAVGAQSGADAGGCSLAVS